MRKFDYKLKWSPYWNSVRAKNKKEAWRRILKLWGPKGAGYARRELLAAVTLF